MRHLRAVGVAMGFLVIAGCSTTSRPMFGRWRGEPYPPAYAPTNGVVMEGPIVSEGVPMAAPPGAIIGPGPIAAPPPGPIVVPPQPTPPLNPPPVGPQPRTVPQTPTTPTKGTR